MPGRLPKNEDAEAGRSGNETSPLIEKPREVSLLHPVQWLRTLSQSYTWKLLAMVACTNHLLKGFVAGGGDEGLIGKPAEFLFGELGVSAGRLQSLKAVAIIPFALKPLVALLSDAFPIAGYHKLPYVVIFTVLSFGALMTLGLGLAVSEAAVVTALFLAFLQVASIDVLMAAKSSEEVKKHAKLGPDFMTYTWLGINVGQVLSVLFLGPVVATLGARAPYCCAAPLVLVVLWPALGNFMGERPTAPQGWPMVFQQHKVLCRLTLLIGALALFLVVSTFTMHDIQLLKISAGMAAVVLMSFAIFIRWEIAGPVIFFFLLGLLNLNIDGALFYFCTDDAAEFPAGPHFSPKFYITGLGGATFLGITVGYATGPALFRSWSYRSICHVTILMRAFSTKPCRNSACHGAVAAAQRLWCTGQRVAAGSDGHRQHRASLEMDSKAGFGSAFSTQRCGGYMLGPACWDLQHGQYPELLLRKFHSWLLWSVTQRSPTGSWQVRQPLESTVHVSSSSLALAVLSSDAGSKESANRAPLGGA
ncbi:unnamed protein product [Cladocopium goreaui]|uniref:Folate-biopterin transporter 2 n=1 Tax=Cladocopium goreaui TaxID=2562237 RepID=A0A9P1C426_9DINO|nr:unnamed protein product [Cladocopium goreaui]